jgi:hypothetical protein
MNLSRQSTGILFLPILKESQAKRQQLFSGFGA